MSYITWKTAKGTLGTVPENEYLNVQIEASDSGGDDVSYFLVSGSPPKGIQVISNGFIRGTPVVSGTVPITMQTSSFTVRAVSSNGALADRTFSLTVNNIKIPEIIALDTFLGSYFDGNYYSHQFEVVDPDPSVTFKWTISSGNLPNGITLSSTGKLEGFLIPIPADDDFGVVGYDSSPSDKYPYDFVRRSKDLRYTFSVRVDDGINFSTKTFQLAVVAKSNFTADNSVYLVNSTFLTIDADNKYTPIITNATRTLPESRITDNIAYKLEYYNFDIGSMSWVSENLPSFLTLDSSTGWITGTVPYQDESQLDHEFGIRAYRTEYPEIISELITFKLRTLGSENNFITWDTDENLGTLENGLISELQLSAHSSNGQEVIFSLVGKPYCSLPQGLSLQQDGLIVGRSTFRYFSLDGDFTVLTLSDTTGIVIGDAITGFNMPSGAKVLDIIDEYRVRATPAIVTSHGIELTFVHSDDTEVVKIVTMPSGSTSFDKNTTTFDNIKKFTVKAETVDGFAESIKTFYVTVDNYNSMPYENVYIKAFPRKEQRDIFANFINDQSVFNDSFIYRLSDPWFGKQYDIKSLFVAGLNPSLLSTYMAAISSNHYLKNINFGNLKSARAMDENFNVKYEVIYVELLDSDNYKNANSPNKMVDLATTVSNPHVDSDGNVYWNYAPNENRLMKSKLDDIVGFSNQGALPDWMSSIQEDGTILGSINAVVLAYVKPGMSEKVLYRAKNYDIEFNDVDFTVDRYQVDNALSENFDVQNSKFINSRETTFDVLEIIEPVQIITVDFALDAQTFDQVNGRSIDYLYNNYGIDGVQSWNTGQTLVFARQENYPKPSKYNEGWNYAIDTFIGRTGYGVLSYDENSIVPGYLEHTMNPLVENRRGGIWRITVDSDSLIWLEFVQQIEIGQVLQVLYGFSHGNSRIIYSASLDAEHNVPYYVVYTNKLNDSAATTYFDNHGTKFIDYRDKILSPQENDKYIKYPYYGALDTK